MTIVGCVEEAVVSDLVPGGVLRAAINLGNPVLAQGTAAAPSGVSVEIARELGVRLGVRVELIGCGAARESLAALVRGGADICFLAIEPARAAEVAFTAPYVLIEGVYVVREDSGLTALADIDREHVRIGVNEGSAYDLFLSRTLRHAAVVRAPDGIGAFCEQGLEAAAGIRQVVSGFAARTARFRVIEERFMQIRQAVGVTRVHAPGTVRFLAAAVEELKANGFISDALQRSGQDRSLVAPPEQPPGSPAGMWRSLAWPEIRRQPPLRTQVDRDLLAEFRLGECEIGRDLLRRQVALRDFPQQLSGLRDRTGDRPLY